MKAFKNNIRYVLRDLRSRSGKNQEQIAISLGISIPAYSKIETGITDLNMSRFIQIAKMFDVSPDVLMARMITGNIDLNDDIASRQKMIDVAAVQDENVALKNEVIDLQRRLIVTYELLNKRTNG